MCSDSSSCVRGIADSMFVRDTLCAETVNQNSERLLSGAGLLLLLVNVGTAHDTRRLSGVGAPSPRSQLL